MACPPEAQAFSTLSIGLLANPGTEAARPETSPCSLSEILQAAPTAPTSSSDGSALISLQTVSIAFFAISGTVMPSSLPNLDWW
jgi:hypothetical protein